MDDAEAYRRAIESAANPPDDVLTERAIYALQRQTGKAARPVGTTQSDFDGLGPVSPPAERDAAVLRASAGAAGDAEPPWGGAYTGSETSKALRRRS